MHFIDFKFCDYIFRRKCRNIFFSFVRANKNMQNIQPNFYCDVCDYKCSKKSSWVQHLETAKHLKAKNCNFDANKANEKYACAKCNIIFKHQSSYCRHKKTCQHNDVSSSNTINISNNIHCITMLHSVYPTSVLSDLPLYNQNGSIPDTQELCLSKHSYSMRTTAKHSK